MMNVTKIILDTTLTFDALSVVFAPWAKGLTDSERLYDDLFTDYRADVWPIENTTTDRLSVGVHFTLHKIMDVVSLFIVLTHQDFILKNCSVISLLSTHNGRFVVSLTVKDKI